MFSEIHKIKELTKLVEKDLGEEVSKECGEILFLHFVKKLLQKRTLNTDDRYLLWEGNKNPIYKFDDIPEAVTWMFQYIREKSHGGCILTVVYISPTLYNSLIESLQIDSIGLIKIFGVSINKGEINDNKIYGIAKSKFKFMPLENIIIIGEINAK